MRRFPLENDRNEFNICLLFIQLTGQCEFIDVNISLAFTTKRQISSRWNHIRKSRKIGPSEMRRAVIQIRVYRPFYKAAVLNTLITEKIIFSLFLCETPTPPSSILLLLLLLTLSIWFKHFVYLIYGVSNPHKSMLSVNTKAPEGVILQSS